MPKCPSCPRRGSCLGERLSHLCGRAGYTAYLANFALDAPSRRRDGRVRVGIVSPCCYLGGAERWISDLLDLCNDQTIDWAGIAIMVAPGDAPTLLADWSMHCPVTVGSDAIARLATDADVLLTWGVIDFPWGLSPAWLESILPPTLPLIIVSHGSIECPAPPGPHRLPHAVPVAVSTAGLRGLPEFRRPAARVILNAVSPDRIQRRRTREQLFEEWGLPANARVAGWLGRLSAEKGPDRFVRGVAALPAGWFGVMAGWGLDADRYYALASREAPGRIRFLGARDDVGDLLAAYDALVMTSDTEACSLALNEALLAGCPVVSTPVGLLEDHPELARLLPRQPSGPEVAAAIVADQADVDGRRRRVELGRRFAETDLSPQRFGREWTELLRCAARPPATSPLVDPAVRDRVNACPHRGSVLPVSQQREGCGCGELSECRLGRGRTPGQVTLRDCLACQA